MAWNEIKLKKLNDKSLKDDLKKKWGSVNL